VGESGAYFRKYRGRDVFKLNFTDRKLESMPDCRVNDTTLVMLPIEFGGEEVLHTVGGKENDQEGVLVSKLYRLTDAGWVESGYPPMKIARKQVAAVCYEKRHLIVIGGIAEKVPTKAVEILDIKKRKWFNTADISFEICQQLQFITLHMSTFHLLDHLAAYGLESLENAIKGIGGDDADDIVRDIPMIMEEFEKDTPGLKHDLLEKLRPHERSLETSLLKQLGLYRMSACICDEYLYILGGFTTLYGQSPLTTAFRAKLSDLLKACSEDYTVSCNAAVFKNIRSLPYIRLTCVTFQGRVLAIGGSNPLQNNICIGDIYEYQPDNDCWNRLDISLTVPRCHCFAADVNNKLMVFGGRPYYNGNPCTDSVEFLTL